MYSLEIHYNRKVLAALAELMSAHLGCPKLVEKELSFTHEYFSSS